MNNQWWCEYCQTTHHEGETCVKSYENEIKLVRERSDSNLKGCHNCKEGEVPVDSSNCLKCKLEHNGIVLECPTQWVPRTGGKK